MKAILTQLEDDYSALLAALDAHDLTAIEDATTALDTTLTQVRGLGWPGIGPDLEAAADRIAALAEAATMRINVLTDHARRRSEALATMRGQIVSATYSR